jgi:hypothetical protein
VQATKKEILVSISFLFLVLFPFLSFLSNSFPLLHLYLLIPFLSLPEWCDIEETRLYKFLTDSKQASS